MAWLFKLITVGGEEEKYLTSKLIPIPKRSSSVLQNILLLKIVFPVHTLVYFTIQLILTVTITLQNNPLNNLVQICTNISTHHRRKPKTSRILPFPIEAPIKKFQQPPNG